MQVNGFNELINKRLILVTGKGGVGKSTCAAAIAMAAAERGKKALLLEFAAHSAFSSLFGLMNLTHQPQEIFTNVYAANLTMEECLREYFTSQLKIKRLVNLALGNKVLARFWRALPSISEVMILYKLTKLEEEEVQGRPQWDVIIVDLPATGHALTMLGMPQSLKRIFPVGPVASQVREIAQLLSDDRKTALTVVTLPEELPVNETVEFIGKVRQKLPIRVEHVIINAVKQELLSLDEEETLHVLKNMEITENSDVMKELIATGEAYQKKVNRAKKAMRSLKGRIDSQFVEVQYHFKKGVELVDAIANQVFPEQAKTTMAAFSQKQ
jgi:arsenite-transporting ATPase